MSERLRKCESFKELREGMVVVVSDCGCGRDRCRGMLVARLPEFADPTSRAPTGYLWDKLPACGTDFDGPAPVGVEDVDEGRVYIVEDGMERSGDHQSGNRRRTAATVRHRAAARVGGGR